MSKQNIIKLLDGERMVFVLIAPVVVFVYNRPEHTKKTIEALAENYLAKETSVFIFSDNAKNEKSIESVKATRKYIDSISEKKFFKSVEIIKSHENRGLANSVINGVSEIIEKFGQVIVVEDDLISSRDFLEYMNRSLEFYRENQSIWSISGYNIPIKISSSYKHDVYLSYRGCSWGWATWSDRWKNVDWEVSDYKEFKTNKKLRKIFNRGGRDMAYMLDLQMNNRIDSWAIRWCYAQSKLNMYTVYPVKSRIKNIGLDGSGTHSGISNHYDVSFNRDNQICNIEDIKINQKISKKFRNHYMSLFKYYWIKPMRFIKQIIIDRSI
ncbi:MAG: glycosyltransferase [Cellulosilyticaceae bacterium]